MLKRLLLFDSIRRFISHHQPLNYPHTTTTTRYTSLSLPFLQSSRRTIQSLKPLSMAERQEQTTSSKSTFPSSHNHTNRLSSEHSPYLLQHAHNPVSTFMILL